MQIALILLLFSSTRFLLEHWDRIYQCCHHLVLFHWLSVGCIVGVRPHLKKLFQRTQYFRVELQHCAFCTILCEYVCFDYELEHELIEKMRETLMQSESRHTLLV